MGDKKTANNTTPDYSRSGFKTGFTIGCKQALAALTGRRFQFIPWPAPSMPTVGEHLEQYSGTTMSATDFDRAEHDWYAMLDERKQAFSRFLNGYRVGCATCWTTIAAGWLCVTGIVTMMLP